MKSKKMIHIVLTVLCVLILTGCDESTTRPDEHNGSGDGDWQPEVVYPLIDEYPSWSPDGNTIAYRHHGFVEVSPYKGGGGRVDYDRAGIWLADADGADHRMVVKGGNHPAWSPDGEKLVCTVDHQIYTVKTDGTDLRRLTSSGRNLFPSWSPNGRRIAYNSKPEDGWFSIWILEVDGSRKIDTGLGGYDPCWSPDQRYLIYFDDEIWRIEVGAYIPEQLTHCDGSFAAYSPDGGTIAFAAPEKNSSEIYRYLQIFVMNADGTDVKQLTTRGGTQPTWSPDGTRIAYLCDRAHEYSSEHGTIWVMNAEDGSNKRQITFSPVPPAE